MIIAILEPNDALRTLVGGYIYEWFPTSDVYLVGGNVELDALCRDVKPDYVIGSEESPILKYNDKGILQPRKMVTDLRNKFRV